MSKIELSPAQSQAVVARLSRKMHEAHISFSTPAHLAKMFDSIRERQHMRTNFIKVGEDFIEMYYPKSPNDGYFETGNETPNPPISVSVYQRIPDPDAETFVCTKMTRSTDPQEPITLKSRIVVPTIEAVHQADFGYFMPLLSSPKNKVLIHRDGALERSKPVIRGSLAPELYDEMVVSSEGLNLFSTRAYLLLANYLYGQIPIPAFGAPIKGRGLLDGLEKAPYIKK